MRLGIFARTFQRSTLEAALDAVLDHDLHAVQFNMALGGGPSLPSSIAPGTAASIRDALGARGLEMSAVSGTYNMAHPDPEARLDGARRLAELIARAGDLGTRVVTLCTGSRDPKDPWRAHPDNSTAAAWEDMRASVEAAVRAAERHDIVVAFEPEHGNVVDGAPAARRLLVALASPHLRVVLAHAKDVTEAGEIVAAGRGAVDYDLYLARLRDHGAGVPLILHGLEEDEVDACVSFLRARIPARGWS
jgi:sugar phosphate isomerase/epimerase